MTISEPNAATGASRRAARTLGRAVLLVAIGLVVGSTFSGGDGRGPEFPAGLFAQDSEGMSASTVEGDYLFFTFRRNLWAIHRPTGKVQFMLFPDGREDDLVRSAVHQIDRTAFPPEEVQYQLSERNLTNYLWVLNPVTGKAYYLRAGRDAGLEASDVETVKMSGL